MSLKKNLAALIDQFLTAAVRYAAWEQPQLFSEELRAGFRSLRLAVAKSALSAPFQFGSALHETEKESLACLI
jgi:hypothetical protein